MIDFIKFKDTHNESKSDIRLLNLRKPSGNPEFKNALAVGRQICRKEEKHMISIQKIQKLRKITSLGMMECKEALVF